MNALKACCAAVGLVLLCGEVAAQPPELPKELSGRWTLAARGASQTFSLDEIKLQADQSFTAKLTWWTIDPKCALRGVPITGRLTETGLAFDATTKCGVSFTAELNRGEKDWQGKGTTKTDTPVIVDIKAN